MMVKTPWYERARPYECFKLENSYAVCWWAVRELFGSSRVERLKKIRLWFSSYKPKGRKAIEIRLRLWFGGVEWRVKGDGRYKRREVYMPLQEFFKEHKEELGLVKAWRKVWVGMEGRRFKGEG